MTATDLGQRSAADLLAGPADDLPRWRDRLERLWVRQVAEITQLSLAFHDAAPAGGTGGLRMRGNWLAAAPQIRYCPQCRR